MIDELVEILGLDFNHCDLEEDPVEVSYYSFEEVIGENGEEYEIK